MCFIANDYFPCVSLEHILVFVTHIVVDELYQPSIRRRRLDPSGADMDFHFRWSWIEPLFKLIYPHIQYTLGTNNQDPVLIRAEFAGCAQLIEGRNRLYRFAQPHLISENDTLVGHKHIDPSLLIFKELDLGGSCLLGRKGLDGDNEQQEEMQMQMQIQIQHQPPWRTHRKRRHWLCFGTS